MGHVVLGVGGERAGGDVGEELVGLVEALREERRDGFGAGGYEGFRGGLDCLIELGEAGLPRGALGGGSVVGDGGK